MNLVVPGPMQYTSESIFEEPQSLSHWREGPALSEAQGFIRDRDLCTATNKRLQCLMNIMYTVFLIIGVYV